MNLPPIIEALRARCELLGGRVAGAADFHLLPEKTSLPVPCAFVIPLDDSPGEGRSQNAVRQDLRDAFAVVVALSNVKDERGQDASATVHAMRAQLWSALLGWQPGEDYKGIEYEGGHMLHLDRARLWYQFEFAAAMEIGPADGWQETELTGLPHFDGGTVTLDAIDPRDPNVVQTPAPDGRVEAGFVFPKAGDLPT